MCAFLLGGATVASRGSTRAIIVEPFRFDNVLRPGGGRLDTVICGVIDAKHVVY